MFIIRTKNPVFGYGFFIGFIDGDAHFQSCYDKRVKHYLTRRGADKQRNRIVNMPLGWKDTATYEVIRVTGLGAGL